MASLKEAATLTSQLEDLAGKLHGELANGEVDFARLTHLADEVGGEADRLAQAFSAMNQALNRTLQENGSGD
jgi:hypothetical protein